MAVESTKRDVDLILIWIKITLLRSLLTRRRRMRRKRCNEVVVVVVNIHRLIDRYIDKIKQPNTKHFFFRGKFYSNGFKRVYERIEILREVKWEKKERRKGGGSRNIFSFAMFPFGLSERAKKKIITFFFFG